MDLGKETAPKDSPLMFNMKPRVGSSGTTTVPLQVAGQVGGEPFLLPSTGFFPECTDPGAVKMKVSLKPKI